jgi:ferredoxin-NADP reductase
VGKEDFVALPDAANETVAKVATHRFLNPTVLEFSIETETPLPTTPGQYAKIIFRDRDGDFSRCYSVVSSEGNRLVFCVRITDGRGGKILAALKVGDDIRVSGIFGAFVLASSDAPKVFIATGTGLSPIMNLMRSANGAKKRLFFGMRTKEEDFYSDELAKIPNLSIRKFLSKGEAKGFETGRIDLSVEPFPKETEFYVCGNPDMVQSTISVLRARGFAKIYSERY